MSRITKILIAATFIDGILASGNINRAFIDMPAWAQVGPIGWATFSRHADLGPAAIILYPFEAFAGMILSVAAAILFYRARVKPRAAALPIYAGALLTVAGLMVTAKAAPIMLSVRHLGNDPVALEQAFRGFQFWGGVRGVFQVLAYCANLWALVAIFRTGAIRASDG